MTDFASLGAPATFSDPVSRQSAFRAARRHSGRVRLLRRLIVLGSTIGVVGVLGYALFNPFRTAIPSVSIDSLGLNGTKITMEHPKLSGFRSDGRPYTLDARTAVQDAKTPNVLELHEIDAQVTMADKSVIHVISELGTYDSSKETMKFDHDVHMTSDSGLDVRMASAFVAFKQGVADTQEPVNVVMNSSTVSADSMHMADNGKEVSFLGHVHSVMLPGEPQAGRPSPAKEARP